MLQVILTTVGNKAQFTIKAKGEGEGGGVGLSMR